jgi:hypothetical protein
MDDEFTGSLQPFPDFSPGRLFRGRSQPLYVKAVKIQKHTNCYMYIWGNNNLHLWLRLAGVFSETRFWRTVKPELCGLRFLINQ